MKQTALPILVLLVIVSLAIVATLPSASVEADHYQRFRDGKSLYTLLSGRIQRGNSLQDVESVLGEGVPLVEDVETHRVSLRESAMWHPDLYPDGVFNEDTFLAWSGNDEKVTLQFRNGYLVNFTPEQFTTWQPSYDVAGQTAGDRDASAEPELIIAGPQTSPIPVVRPEVVSQASAD